MTDTPAITPHVERRLSGELMMWLSTVRPDGRPHLVPIWFLWQGGSVLFFSQPGAQKVRNLRHQPQVVLSLDTAAHGEDIVIIEGVAELLSDPAIRSAAIPEYISKYRALIDQLGWVPETMAAEYSQAIRVRPTRVRAWGGEQESSP